MACSAGGHRQETAKGIRESKQKDAYEKRVINVSLLRFMFYRSVYSRVWMLSGYDMPFDGKH